jgi:hypothetical protein
MHSQLCLIVNHTCNATLYAHCSEDTVGYQIVTPSQDLGLIAYDTISCPTPTTTTATTDVAPSTPFSVTTTSTAVPAASRRTQTPTVAVAVAVATSIVLLVLLAMLYLFRRRKTSIVEVHRLAVPINILAEVSLHVFQKVTVVTVGST